MIVETGRYVLTMIGVLAGCVFRDFLIPLFVWRKHLRGKGYGYCFWFCTLTQAFIQINIVSILGIFNILNRITFIGFNLVVYSLILWNYSDKKFFIRIKNACYSLWKAYKEEWLKFYLIRSAGKRAKFIRKTIIELSIWKKLKKHWLEILLITGIIIYNIWFMSHNIFMYHCFQFSDIPVHQSWIYELEQGNLYADGIYPFGMHIMIYFVRVVFRINLREIMLYAGAYQFAVLVISIYLLAREIFAGKYIPIAVILILSFMINQGRFSASLPQESGIYTVAATAYFMIRYLHKKKEKFVLESDSKVRRLFRINTYINGRYIDSELYLLMLSVTLVVSYHYYSAIAAVLAVLAIGLAYMPRILKKQYLVPLLFSGTMGALIAIIPIGICLLKGIPFQESTAWARTVMTNEEWKGSDTEYQKNLALALGDDSLITDSLEDETDKVNKEEESIYSGKSVSEILKYYIESIYNFGSSGVMFGSKATKLMFECIAIGLFCAFIMFLSGKFRVYAYDYIALIMIILLYFTTGCLRALELPQIIASDRAPTFAQPFIGFIYMLPVDFLFRILSPWKNRFFQYILRVLSLAVCVMAAFLILREGWYHNYFDVNQAYYNEVEYVLRNIRKSYKKYSYTIVSTNDEYYDVIDHGRHTEISEFVNMVSKNEESFTFTTDYVFFFIEKLILHDYNYGRVRVAPEFALNNYVYMAEYQDYNYQRAVIQSRAYYWAEKFRTMYPQSIKVYYEDDIYIVYLMEQNTYFPYNLQIDFLDDLKDQVYVKMD